MSYNIFANRTLNIKSVANQMNNVTILTSPALATVCCAIGILQLTEPRGVSYCLKGCQKMKSLLKFCECGCGQAVTQNRRFITHHNLKIMVKTPEHLRKIGEGQKRAWQTKRKRTPVGSKYIDVHGYVRVKVVPGVGRWEKEHILVMENCINRKLSRDEVVHHINGKPDDNRIDNLYLCKNLSEHTKIHWSLLTLIASLLDEGLVRFDKDTGRYERVL